MPANGTSRFCGQSDDALVLRIPDGGEQISSRPPAPGQATSSAE